MSSIIPGYEYDIFISYRQKDNKHDGWVTEFVDNLKGELESTFKEEISVYFDINPHDGLLETHDVDESLKEKLKCLVFIPILSRTYCDPKAFAWEHEFKAFINQASQDKYGLKIKLPTGNVANRVLPVRIHDLDPEDIELCESILGGVLRGIEFIYKEPGVNRSLTPKDHEKKNLNNTNYRNQINKVALAIKEIIQGMKAGPVPVVKEKFEPKELLEEAREEKKKEVQEEPVGASKRRLLIGSMILAVILVVAAIIFYPKLFKRDPLARLKSSDGRISVAVLPFQNMTNDTIWNIWQDGIQENLITYLSNFPEELIIGQPESINTILQSRGITNYASITPSVAMRISQKLDANVFIYGSIQQAGNKLRVNTKLIDSNTEEVLKSFELDGPYKEEIIFDITDSLRRQVTDFLIISKLKKGDYPDFDPFVTTSSPKAYKYFIYGKKAFFDLDYTTAKNMLLQAIGIDSNLTFATFMLSYAYLNEGKYDESKKWCSKLYEKRNQMSILQKTDVERQYAANFGTTYDVIKYLKQLLVIDNQNPRIYYNLGSNYNKVFQYENAIAAFEKALEIYNYWDSRPLWVYNYTQLGLAYHNTGQYKKEGKLYKKAEQDFPEDERLIYSQAVLSLSEGNIDEANHYCEKYKTIRQDKSASEVSIAEGLARIYSEAGILDKAEDYYRKADALDSKGSWYKYKLAYYLIDKDRNVPEGMELVNKALEKSPENYNYLHTKGWGLYKQGKYQEAFEMLQKSWDLRREKAVYDHEAFLHLEAAKKAVADQKK